MVQQYLGLRHEYGVCDCITLVHSFYKQELGLDFILPDYPHSTLWMRHFTLESIDDLASKYSVKVKLTEGENYDVIAFKTRNCNFITHFGILLKPTQMLHIEEGGVSCVERLSDYWINNIHSLYRHESLV